MAFQSLTHLCVRCGWNRSGRPISLTQHPETVNSPLEHTIVCEAGRILDVYKATYCILPNFGRSEQEQEHKTYLHFRM